MKTVILGLGNTILTDDGVGIYVVRQISSLIEKISGRHRDQPLHIKEASVGGFNFIDLLSGYDRAVIIDAIHTKNGSPGEFYELDPNCLKPSARLSSIHGIDLATACNMAKEMKIDFPAEIKIYAMEVEDEFSFGEECTPSVSNSIQKMAEEIVCSLKRYGWL